MLTFRLMLYFFVAAVDRNLFLVSARRLVVTLLQIAILLHLEEFCYYIWHYYYIWSVSVNAFVITLLHSAVQRTPDNANH